MADKIEVKRPKLKVLMMSDKQLISIYAKLKGVDESRIVLVD